MKATVSIKRETPVKPLVTVTITCSEERLQYLQAILYKYEGGAHIHSALVDAMGAAGIARALSISTAASAAVGR